MIEGIQENIVVKVDSETDVDESELRKKCEELLFIHYGRRIRVELVEIRGTNYIYEPVEELPVIQGVLTI